MATIPTNELEHVPMTPQQFITWRLHNGYSIARAARLLDVTRATVYSWEAGKYPIPETVKLACSALQVGIRSWPPSSLVNQPDPSSPTNASERASQ